MTKITVSSAAPALAFAEHLERWKGLFTPVLASKATSSRAMVP